MSSSAPLPTLGSSTDAGSSSAASAAPTGSSASSPSGSASSGSATASQGGTGVLTDAPNLSSAASSLTATSSVSGITGAPSLTSTNFAGLTGLPTLSGYYSYPPPTVPPTSNAPYMQSSSLPENFIFIIVGAIIAFVAILIIGWRALTSWSINRRFRRGDIGVSGSSYTPLADFKQKPNVKEATASQYDMKDLSDKLPKQFSSVPSLFFSPTAEVANRQSSRPESRHVSQHMPAGHYRDASDSRR